MEFRTVSKHGLLFGVYMACVGDVLKTIDTENGYAGNGLYEILTTWIPKNKDKVDGIMETVIGIVKDFDEMGNIW